MPISNAVAETEESILKESRDPSPYFASIAEVERLVNGFETGTLPRSEWTHQAHMTIAYLYITRYSDVDATSHIRDGIKKYNTAKGIENTRTNGYHETITLFWIWAVRRYLSMVDSNLSVLDLINGLLATYGKNFPLEYYSRDLLMSWEARCEWREPDLKPLDR